MKNLSGERDEHCLKGKYMSANDHVRNWHLKKTTKIDGTNDNNHHHHYYHVRGQEKGIYGGRERGGKLHSIRI